MDNLEFKKKLIVLIIEKGVIVIIVALVGYWINASLKEMDHKNAMLLQQQVRWQKEAQNKFDRLKDSLIHINRLREMENQSSLEMERDSLKGKLDKALVAHMNFYQKVLDDHNRSFIGQQNRLKEAHELNLSELQARQDAALQDQFLKIKAELDTKLTSLKSSLDLLNQLNLTSTEKVGQIWSKIYELELLGEELIVSVIEFDKRKRTTDSLARVYGNSAPTPLFGWSEGKISKTRDRYLELKKEIEIVIRKEQFWLSDAAIQGVKDYLKIVDVIADPENARRFRFLFPELGRGRSARNKPNTIPNLDSLITIKNRIRTTLFSESIRFKQAG